MNRQLIEEETQKSMKKLSLSLVIVEMQIKAMMGNRSGCQNLNLTVWMLATGGALGILYITCRGISWCSLFEEQLEISQVGGVDTLQLSCSVARYT